MKKTKAVLLGVILWSLLLVSGCNFIRIEEEPRKPLEYSIVKNEDLPAELAALIQEKKANEFQLTYQSEKELFLIKGYGQQMSGGYSISVEELGVTSQAVFFRTQAQTLDGLMFGEEAASTIGINTFRCRLVYLLVLSVLTGALVSVCGTIGFVGLIIPHVSRAIAGTAHRKLLPIAALSGGLFMLWVDAIARSLIPNTELPVGIFTALVGAPFFVYVMVRKKYGFGGN